MLFRLPGRRALLPLVLLRVRVLWARAMCATHVLLCYPCSRTALPRVGACTASSRDNRSRTAASSSRHTGALRDQFSSEEGDDEEEEEEEEEAEVEEEDEEEAVYNAYEDGGEAGQGEGEGGGRGEDE